jgi:O-acetyl-ADP-ribose deacetylase (regulator of RNase III)
MKIVKGNILNSKEKYILQQCNCLTVRSHGLSKTLADKWEWADVYKNRRSLNNRNLAIESDRDEPGTIKILSSPDEDKMVICLFGQWAPSQPQKYKSYPKYEIDTYDNRKKWFKMCLDEIGELDIDVVAVPWQIGCGLAGGNWSEYKEMLEEFEEKYEIECVLYQL